MIDLFHVEGVEVKQEVAPVHQIRKRLERILLIPITVYQYRTGYIAHSLHVAEVRPQHRIGN